MALFGRGPDKETLAEQLPKAQPRPAEGKTQVQAPRTDGAATPTRLPPQNWEGKACLDKGTRLSGKVTFDGPALIDGQVEGEVASKDVLIIGESGVVAGPVKAASVVVAGRVSGDITAGQRIEIRPSGKVVGNLACSVLVVHEGALFEGHCAMYTEAAREERKVTVFPKEVAAQASKSA